MNPYDVQTNPYNESQAISKPGLLTQFVQSIPGSVVNFGKTVYETGRGIAQGIGQSALSVGASLLNDIFPDKGYGTVEVPKSLQPIIGTTQIKDLSTRIAEAEQTIQSSPFAKKYGLDKYSLPLAFGGIVGATTLDLTPIGGSESAAKLIAKETNPEKIFTYLTKTGVAEDLARMFAPKLAETTSVTEIKDALKLIKQTQDLAGLTAKFEASAPDLAKLEAPASNVGISELPKELTTAEGLLRKPVGTETLVDTIGKLPKSELDSLKPIIDQALPTVKNKVHALDYFGTPEFVLEKIGLGKESALLHDSYDAYRKELKDQIGKLIVWKNEVADIPNASEQIFKYLDGQKVDLVPAEQKVADEMKAYLKDWADRLGLPEDKRIASYITHIFEPDFIKKEFDPDLAKLIVDKVPGSVYDPFLEQRLGAKGFQEDVFAALDAYVKRATRKVNMDPALNALKNAADKLDLESYNYVQRLASRINLRPTEIDNLVDNFVKSVVGYRFGQRPVAKLSQGMRSIFYRGGLGLNIGSALRNLTQGVNTYAKLGEKYTLTGYTKLFGKMITGNLDELTESGVLQDVLLQDKKIGVYKTLLQKLDKGLFYFFETAEKINRGAAYFGAKSKYLAKGMSEEEAVKAAKRLVRETQFAFGSIDSPVALSSDIMKTAFQYQTFNVKQIEFLKNMIKNKELAGLVRYTVGSFAMLYSIGRAFGMQPKDLIPTFRLGGSPFGNALSVLGGLVSPDQQKRNEAKTKIGSTISSLIPAGAQIRKTAQGIKAYNQGKDVTATGRTRFTIPQTPGKQVQSFLFGKSALPEAQKYYQGIGKKKESTSNPYNP